MSSIDASFVETQARLRMGRFLREADTEFPVQISAIDFESLNSAVYRPFWIIRQKKSRVDKLYQRYNHYRNDHFVGYLEKEMPFFDSQYIIDFEDSIPTRYHPFDDLNIPVFAKNKPIAEKNSVILWTNNRHRALRDRGASGEFSKIRWDEKIPEIIWRGNPHASFLLSNGTFADVGRIVNEYLNNNESIISFIKDGRGNYDIKATLDSTMPRFNAVSLFSNRYDICFVDTDETFRREDVLDLLKKLYSFGDKKSIYDLARYKYHLVLEGFDTATQINWSLSSNSIVLMPARRFDSTISLGLLEWYHFVPIREDLSDLDARLVWCKENDEQCRWIASNAYAYAAKFTAKTEDLINHRVLSLYNRVEL